MTISDLYVLTCLHRNGWQTKNQLINLHSTHKVQKLLPEKIKLKVAVVKISGSVIILLLIYCIPKFEF